MEKASSRTQAENSSYSNRYGETINVEPTLVELREVVDPSFEDGSVLYARYFRNHDAYEQLGFEDFSKERWPNPV